MVEISPSSLRVTITTAAGAPIAGREFLVQYKSPLDASGYQSYALVTTGADGTVDVPSSSFIDSDGVHGAFGSLLGGTYVVMGSTAVVNRDGPAVASGANESDMLTQVKVADNTFWTVEPVALGENKRVIYLSTYISTSATVDEPYRNLQVRLDSGAPSAALGWSVTGSAVTVINPNIPSGDDLAWTLWPSVAGTLSSAPIDVMMSSGPMEFGDVFVEGSAFAQIVSEAQMVVPGHPVGWVWAKPAAASWSAPGPWLVGTSSSRFAGFNMTRGYTMVEWNP